MKLKAEFRDVGKQVAKRLRRQGKIPAVMYGHGEETVHIAIDKKEFMEVLKAGDEIVKISLNGEEKDALIKEVQFHPVTDEVIHVDFQHLKKGEKVRVKVPVILEGTPVGVQKGGILEQILHEIEIECLAEDIPHEFKVDVSHLDLEEALHVKDIDIGNRRLLTPPDETVATIIAPRKVEEEEKKEEVAEEEKPEEKAEEKKEEEKEE